MRIRRAKLIISRMLFSILLVLLVGSLGSHLIDYLTGEKALIHVAEASSVSTLPQWKMESKHVQLDPGQPGQIHSIEFSLANFDAERSDHFHISFRQDSDSTYTCRKTDGNNNWSCPTPGLSIAAVDSFTIYSD